MIKVDLITGFLGSGKTTFIKEYAQYLIDSGLCIGILENDFGAVNVDMMLLAHLEGRNCDLEMIAGGCDKDCHIRRFKTKLTAMGMLGYDRILIEPSGIFDVDEFFDILHEEPLDRWYEIGSVITILDGGLKQNLSAKSRYMLASQINCSGCVIMSKMKETDFEKIERNLGYVNSILEDFGADKLPEINNSDHKKNGNKVIRTDCDVMHRDCDVMHRDCDVMHRDCDVMQRDCDVMHRDYDELHTDNNMMHSNSSDVNLIFSDRFDFSSAEYESIMELGYRVSTLEKLWFDEKDQYQSLYYMNTNHTLQQIEEIAKSLLNDWQIYGNVFRIKGFLLQSDGSWLEINATKDKISFNPINVGQKVIIVIGENLDEDRINKCFEIEDVAEICCREKSVNK